MHSLRLLAVAGIIAIAASCGGGSSTTGGGGGGGGGGGCSGTNAAPAVCNNFFSPSSITVAAGGTVTFAIKGNAGHNITFLSAPGGAALPPSSGTLTSGSYTTPALSAGTYTFECSIHPAQMQGQITVTP